MIEAELVYNESFTARNFNTSPLTISGLDGDVYDYECIIFLGAGTSNTDFHINFNSDTASNYRRYYMRGVTSTALASAADSESEISLTRGTRTADVSFIKFTVTGSSGYERYVSSLHGSNLNGVAKTSGYWKNTADSISSIDLSAASSTVTDAHIMLYRTPKVSEQSNWELMETQTVTAQNLNSNPVIFSGLSLDSAGSYKVVWEDLVSTNLKQEIRLNNDTGSNYKQQGLRNNNGSLSADSRTQTFFYTGLSNSNNTPEYGEFIISGESGVERLSTINFSSQAGPYEQYYWSNWWLNTADDLTEIRILNDNNSTVSGFYKLYRKIEPSTTGDTLPFEVVKSIPLSGTNFSAGETISLLGDSINVIKVEGLLSSMSGNHEIRMQLNSDTAANYPEQLLKGDTSTSSAASTTRNYIVLAKLQNGDQSEFTTYLYPRSGDNRPMLTQCSYDENAIEFLGQWWADSASEITTAKIYASSSNAVTGDIKFSRLVGNN